MLRHKIDCDKCPERILLFCQVFVFLSFFYSMFLFFSIYYVLHKKRIICHFYNSESSTTDNQTKREVEETMKIMILNFIEVVQIKRLTVREKKLKQDLLIFQILCCKFLFILHTKSNIYNFRLFLQ